MGVRASVLGYITTQLKRALSTVFGPAGLAVSGATVVVAYHGAPTRSVDDLDCLALSSNISRKSGVFPCGRVLFERCWGTGLVKGLEASLSRPRGGRSAVLSPGDAGSYASSSNRGSSLRLG